MPQDICQDDNEQVGQVLVNWPGDLFQPYMPPTDPGNDHKGNDQPPQLVPRIKDYFLEREGFFPFAVRKPPGGECPYGDPQNSRPDCSVWPIS